MVSGNAQKTPFGRTLNEAAAKKARDAIQLLGKSLPCSIVSVDGWIVEVKFELDTDFTLPNVTVPVASSKYDYLPLQEGDPGVVRAADARLGGLSGLGGGTAKLSLAANLSTLIFEPFGHVTNEEWVPPDDPLFRVVQGPHGVIIQDLNGNAIVTVDGDGKKITAALGTDASIEMDGTAKTITAKTGDNISAILTETDVTLQYDDGGDPIKVLVNSTGAQMEYGADNYINVTDTTAEMTVGSSSITVDGSEININAATVKVNGTPIP